MSLTKRSVFYCSDLLEGFEIAGNDQVFHKASATIKGKQVIVSSKSVNSPVAVRYAYKGFPYANLYNEEGLPASPFRTDQFEIKFDQDNAALWTKRFYLPRQYSKIQTTIEQKRQLAKIQDAIIPKKVEKRLNDIWKKRVLLLKKKASKSKEMKQLTKEYNDLLTPLQEKITKEAVAAGIFK